MLCSDFLQIVSLHVKETLTHNPPPTSVVLSLQQQGMWKPLNEAVRMFSTLPRPRTELNTSNVPPALDKKIHSCCLTLYSAYVPQDSLLVNPVWSPRVEE